MAVILFQQLPQTGSFAFGVRFPVMFKGKSMGFAVSWQKRNRHPGT